MAAAKNLIQFMKAFEMLSRPGGISIKEIQENLSISRRSVYRLFESMEELGYPLVDTPMDGKTKNWGLMAEYVSSRPSGRVPRLSLNTAEIMILYQILSRQTPLYESGMKQTITALRSRLEQFYLENSGAEELQRFKDIFINIPGQYKQLGGKEKIYETLLQAALEKKYCKGSYRSFRDGSRKIKELDFAPLCFFEWNYGLYCFVYRKEDKALRTMALERFETITMSDRLFREKLDFNPESMLEDAWALTCNDPISAVIHFSKEAAPYIHEREWQSGQRIELNVDGSVILKLKTSGRRDIKSWVLSFGKDAELLKPLSLRQEINEELKQLYIKYKN